MKKSLSKIISIFLLSLFLLTVFAVPAAALAGNQNVQNEDPDHPLRLVDEADIFTDEEETELLGELDRISTGLKIDLAIVTVVSTGDKTPGEYAADYFEYNGYGQGEDRDGLLILRSLEPEDVYISTHGKAAEYFDELTVNAILDAAENDMSTGNYAEAFRNFISLCEGNIIYEDSLNEEPNGQTGDSEHPPRLVDEAELLTDEEEKELLGELDRVSTEQGVDVAIVTVDSTGDKTPEEYADDYYDYNGYGLGDDRDGILILRSLDPRYVHISTCGKAIEYFDDFTINCILDAIENDIRSENYAEAFRIFISECEGDIIYGASLTENQNTYTDDPNHPPRLVDEADLLTDEEETELIGELDRISLEQGVDVAIVTVVSTDGKSPEEYADDYFDYNGYGLGEDRSGLLMLRSLDPRYIHISTCGKAIEYFTDSAIDSIFDDIESAVHAENYAAAFGIFANRCENIIINGKNSSFIPDDDEHTPHFWYGPHLQFHHILIALAIGFVLSLIPMGIMKSSMKSVEKKTEAQDYVLRDSIKLTNSSDMFLYKNVTKTEIEHESSSGGGFSGGGGGSSTHTSSSGATHGGGGRSM